MVSLVDRGETYACDVAGPSPAATPVVLLHGWTATGLANWSATIELLAERHRVVALDHRGHGRGMRSAAPFTLEDCADDVVALLDALGIERAVLVGYSMGGPIAQLVWRRHPERVQALVLCATAADFTSTMVQPRIVQALEALAKVGTIVPRSVRMRAVWPLAALMISDVTVRNRMVAGLRAHDEAVIAQAGRAIRAYDARRWIGDIDVPVSVVITDRDRVVRPELQQALAAAVPGASVIHVDGAHMAPFTRSGEFAAAVGRAVEQVTRAAATPSPAASAARGWWRRRGRRWLERRAQS